MDNYIVLGALMKKCLLIAPLFNGYYKEIMGVLIEKGFLVDYERDQFSNDTFSFIKKRLFRNYVKKSTDKYVNSICEKHENIYDAIIIILAYSFSKENILQLKRKYSKAKIIYYAWDSVSNFKVIKELADASDFALSFDPYDCKKYGYSFLPLFYSESISNKSEKQYMYSSIMSIYPTKIKQLEKVLNLIPEDISGYKYFVVKSRLFYIYYKLKYSRLFRGYRMKDFRYRGLNKKKVYQVFANSKVVLDIPLENQIGLTMRTFEALALGCKLITTNSDIKNYDFYNKKNIFVIDDSTKEIPSLFFEEEFDNKYKISDSYSINSFVDKLIECLKKDENK